MAGKIPQAFIDDLLERTDIVELIDARVKLKKTGRNYSALCPFHQEKTPSFSVNPDRQFYYCFGCGAGGNAVSFLMDFERRSFVETIEDLARQHGLDIPYEDDRRQRVPRENRQSIYTLMEQVSHYYQQQLRQHPQRQKAVDYLKQRGLSGEICKTFQIGYAPAGWDNLLREFGQTPAGLRLLLDAGMVIEREDGSGHYDRFRDRLMFPIHDNRGRIIAFGGRVLNDDKPKYLNSPETVIFHKQQELYGLYHARQANRHLQRLIMVEGYMDVVALAQFGINNAVATLGTAAGTAHMEKVFRHSSEIVFCFDGDEAGKKAARRALDAVLPLMQSGRQARFLFLPEGEDPDSWVRNIGADKFNWQLQQAGSLTEYLFALCSEGLDLARADDRAMLISKLMPYASQLPDGPLKSLLLRSLSEKTGLPVEELQQLDKPAAPRAEAAQAASPATAEPRQRQKLTAEQRAVRKTPARTAALLLLLNPPFAALTPDLPDWLADDSDDKRLLRALMDYLQQHPDTSTAAMLGYWLGKQPVAITALLALNLHHDGAEQQQQEYLDAVQRLAELQQREKNGSLIEKLKQNPHIHPADMNDEEREAFLALFHRPSQ